jgi:hypothetical protein
MNTTAQEKPALPTIFTMPPPWEITVVSCSEKNLRIDFKMHYQSPLFTCPVCSCTSAVRQLIPAAWRAQDHGEFNCYITAYLPVTREHYQSCQVAAGKDSIPDIMVLDIITNQLGYAAGPASCHNAPHAVAPPHPSYAYLW